MWFNRGLFIVTKPTKKGSRRAKCCSTKSVTFFFYCRQFDDSPECIEPITRAEIFLFTLNETKLRNEVYNWYREHYRCARTRILCWFFIAFFWYTSKKNRFSFKSICNNIIQRIHWIVIGSLCYFGILVSFVTGDHPVTNLFTPFSSFDNTKLIIKYWKFRITKLKNY